jgi:hypothetical protein
MNILVALAVGYIVGAKTGGKDLDQLGKSLKALCGTDEFADVVSAARAQMGSTLRELASIMDGGQLPDASSGDLVARVRHLVDRE